MRLRKQTLTISHSVTTGTWSLCSLSRAATAIITAPCVSWCRDIHCSLAQATPTTTPGPLETTALCSRDNSNVLVSYKNITDHAGLFGKNASLHFIHFSTFLFLVHPNLAGGSV